MVDTCCICLEDLSSNTHALPCQHILHTSCFNELDKTSNKCPLCRKEFKKTQLPDGDEHINVGMLMRLTGGESLYVRPLSSININLSDYYSFDYTLNLQLTDQLHGEN